LYSTTILDDVEVEDAQQGGTPWYSKAWRSYWWNMAETLGLHGDTKNGVGIVIYGAKGQKVYIDFSQLKLGKGKIGVVDFLIQPIHFLL